MLGEVERFSASADISGSLQISIVVPIILSYTLTVYTDVVGTYWFRNFFIVLT